MPVPNQTWRKDFSSNIFIGSNCCKFKVHLNARSNWGLSHVNRS